jgi:hypothetical protein
MHPQNYSKHGGDQTRVALMCTFGSDMLKIPTQTVPIFMPDTVSSVRSARREAVAVVHGLKGLGRFGSVEGERVGGSGWYYTSRRL